jgi:hypothetical protein
MVRQKTACEGNGAVAKRVLDKTKRHAIQIEVIGLPFGSTSYLADDSTREERYSSFLVLKEYSLKLNLS